MVVWVVHAWVGQIVTFFAYRPPSRPLDSPTLTQPGRVTNPTQGHPKPPWEAPQAEEGGRVSLTLVQSSRHSAVAPPPCTPP